MRKIYQTDHSHKTGNCLQASVASILELDLHEVPNFNQVYNHDWPIGLQDFLDQFELDVVFVNKLKLPTTHILVVRPSFKLPNYHAVVARNGRVIHNPTGPTASNRFAEKIFSIVFTPKNPAKVINNVKKKNLRETYYDSRYSSNLRN